jgi:hypothetical protein
LNCSRKKFGPNFKELWNFLPKKLSLSSQKYELGIRDPGSEIRDPGVKKAPIPDPGSQIPDPGVKKAPIPDPGSATLICSEISGVLEQTTRDRENSRKWRVLQEKAQRKTRMTRPCW